MAQSASNASRDIEAGSTTGSTPPPAARPQVDVVAISQGDEFLIELGEMISGQATVHPVDTVAAAVEQLWNSRRGQVLVADTRELADVRAELQQAVTQAPHAVLLVFAPAGEETQVGEAVKGLPVQAVLTIPLDRRRATPAVVSALADAAARGPGTRRLAPPPQESPQPSAAQPGFGALTLEPEPKGKAGLWVGLALAAVAAGGAGYWILHTGPRTSVAQQGGAGAGADSPAAAGDAAADAAQMLAPKLEIPLVAGKLDDLLEQARLAMRSFHYMEPEKESALLYYRSALGADPNNAEAKDGLQRIATWGLARFDESLGKGRLDDAANTLAGLKQTLPGDARLTELEQRLTERQMARLVAEGSIDAANKLLAREAAVITPDQASRYRDQIAHREEEARLGRIELQVEAAIRDGRLLEPAEDCARTFVQQLPPKSSQYLRAVHNLGAALLRRARDAKGGPDTDRYLKEAGNIGVPAGEIDGVRRDIAQAQKKAESERLAGLFHERLHDGRLTDPAQDSAAFYLGQLQAADPGAFAAASHDLAAKLLERARTSFSQGKGALAEADLNQARKFGADPKDVTALQQQEAARLASVASVAASSAKAASSPGESAPATGSAVPKILRYSQPEFPQKALQQNVGGSVTVQFIIDVNGDPRDIRVVEATPPGIFDRAALAAVKRWHYQPTVVDGKPTEVPVQMPIRFPKPE